jgi:hypothetical protein
MRPVFRIEAVDEREVDRRLLDLDALLLDLLRQERQRGLDLVVDLDLGGVRVGALVEGQRDLGLTRR